MNRFYHIDFLRAISIIGVIIIHVFSFNLTNSFNIFIWNWLHFVVGAFLFCSGYVLFTKYQDSFTNISSIFVWYKKRLVRLLIPYYIFSVFYFSLIFLFPKFFSGFGVEKSFAGVLKSIVLFGGIDLNWLVLLFVELTILFPLILKFLRTREWLWGYVLFVVSLAVYFSVKPFPYDYYRLVMWIPWSLVLLCSFYVARKSFSFNRYVKLATMSGVLFFLLFFLWNYFGKSLSLYDNKYPPNLFDLSYEIFGTFLTVSLSTILIFSSSIVKKAVEFLSSQSYQLFFIHWIILDCTITFLQKNQYSFPVVFEFLFVLSASVLISYFLKRIRLAIIL